MLRQAILTSVLATALAACAGHRASSISVSPVVATQLRSTYACVVNVIASAGYPIVTNEQRFSVRGQIREEIGAENPRVQGAQVGGAGFGVREQPADEGTPYTLDGVSAGVKVDDATGRVVVVAGAYTGSGLTRKSGYVSRPASLRGTSTANQARACADGVRSSD
jgi:hypothetical protein